jgi:hypothetical protein
MSITFSSCFYILKSKFDAEIYINWMNNFISIVNNFNLVIFTDENSYCYIDTKGNPKIKIIIKSLDQFYNNKYKDEWIKNHDNNLLLKNAITWEVNMLWNEKIWFVNETIQKKHFDTELYGWCDIGYFRNRIIDLPTSQLSSWPCENKLEKLNIEKIHYACINNNNLELNYLLKMVKNKNSKGLPQIPIPPRQQSIAGGFFILHKDKIDWWRETYERKLNLYFENNYLIKDDQMIILDCIFSNLDKFNLIRENNRRYDNWFLFQRYLS